MKADVKEFSTQLVAIVLALSALLVLSFSDVARAQSSEDITLDEPDSSLLDDTSEDTTSTEDTATTKEAAGVPDTGFAPSNRVAASALVFVGGVALGGIFGFGYLKLRNKQQS